MLRKYILLLITNVFCSFLLRASDISNVNNIVVTREEIYLNEFKDCLAKCPESMMEELYELLPYLKNLSFKGFSDELVQLKECLKQKSRVFFKLGRLRDKYSYHKMFFELVSYEFLKISYVKNDLQNIMKYNSDCENSQAFYIKFNAAKIMISNQIYYMKDRMPTPAEYEYCVNIIRRNFGNELLNLFIKKYNLCCKKYELKNMCESGDIFVVSHAWNLVGKINDSKCCKDEAKLLFVEFLINQNDVDLDLDASFLFKSINKFLLEEDCIDLYDKLSKKFYN